MSGGSDEEVVEGHHQHSSPEQQQIAAQAGPEADREVKRRRVAATASGNGSSRGASQIGRAVASGTLL